MLYSVCAMTALLMRIAAAGYLPPGRVSVTWGDGFSEMLYAGGCFCLAMLALQASDVFTRPELWRAQWQSLADYAGRKAREGQAMSDAGPAAGEGVGAVA
jgi:hypothetical protein